MNRVAEGSFCMVLAALFCFCGASRLEAQAQAQTPATPPPAQATAQQSADKDKDKDKENDEDANPFAPEPAPTLPPGMTGSDVNDPRAKLAPGLYDAGQASMGIRLLALVKKPEAFQLGSSDPDDPKVQKVISQIRIAGSRAQVKTIEFLQADGDRSEMTITSTR